MNRAIQVGLALSIWAAPGLCDQKGPKPSKPAPVPHTAGTPRANAPANSPGAKGGNANAGAAKAPGMNNPANQLQRFLRMTPEEQERVIDKAPPPQQARLRAALEKFQSLPPQRREFLIRQGQAFDRLPPATQELVHGVFEAFNKLPDERKMLVRAAVNQLRRLPESDRLARINSDQFKARFSPDEQQIVSGLALNLPPDYPLAGQ